MHGVHADFGRAIEAFEAAAERTLKTCAGIPQEVWTAPTSAGPIADIVEHMAISNGLFVRRLEPILAGPTGSQPFGVYDDDEIAHLFERAPEPPGVAQPTGTWTDRDVALQRFGETVAPLAHLKARDPGDVRSRGAPHPLFGPLDAYQWALFSSAHTERHRSQIIGLINSAGR